MKSFFKRSSLHLLTRKIIFKKTTQMWTCFLLNKANSKNLFLLNFFNNEVSNKKISILKFWLIVSIFRILFLRLCHDYVASCTIKCVLLHFTKHNMYVPFSFVYYPSVISVAWTEISVLVIGNWYSNEYIRLLTINYSIFYNNNYK